MLSWEAGLKSQLWDDRLRLNFAVFRYQVDDQQLTAVGGDANIARLVNADKTIGQGVELDLEAYLTRNLLVTFGAASTTPRSATATSASFPAPTAPCSIPPIPAGRARC